MPLVQLVVLEVGERIVVFVLLGNLNGWYFIGIAPTFFNKACLKNIKVDVDILVDRADACDEPRLLGEDSVELHEIRATADVYLLRINAFTIPAIELIRISSMEHFSIAGQDAKSHVAAAPKESEEDSSSTRTQCHTEPAILKETGGSTDKPILESRGQAAMEPWMRLTTRSGTAV